MRRSLRSLLVSSLSSLLILVLILNVGVAYASSFDVTATVVGKPGSGGSGCGTGTSSNTGSWTLTVTKIIPKLSAVHIVVWGLETSPCKSPFTGTTVASWTIGHAKVGDTFTTGSLSAGTYSVELTYGSPNGASLILKVTAPS